MIPMLRSLASALSAEATVFLPCIWCSLSAGVAASALSARDGRLAITEPFAPVLVLRRLPSVVSERLVRLGHLVRVLTPLHRGAEAVARVEQLVLEPLDHGLLTAGLGILDNPPQPEGHLAGRPHLHRHLIGRATNAAAADLESRLHVV